MHSKNVARQFEWESGDAQDGFAAFEAGELLLRRENNTRSFVVCPLKSDPL